MAHWRQRQAGLGRTEARLLSSAVRDWQASTRRGIVNLGRGLSPLRRDRQAGVTLVEVLVVLVLVGVMAGVIGLGIGGANRGVGIDREVQLLTARLNRAADEAVLTGVPAVFVWTGTGYRFALLQDQVWVAHPVAILGTAHDLDRGVAFQGDAARGGQFVILSSLRPLDGAALRLPLAADKGVVFDGLTARAFGDGDL